MLGRPLAGAGADRDRRRPRRRIISGSGACRWWSAAAASHVTCNGALDRGLAPSAAGAGRGPRPRRRWLRHAELGARAFHAELAARDPASAALAAGDTQRVKRAWAVLESTGRPLAAWRAKAHAPLAGPVLRILVRPPRAALYRACDSRFRAMMAAGALDEVRALEALALDPALAAMKALGVPELRAPTSRPTRSTVMRRWRGAAGDAALRQALSSRGSAGGRYGRPT